MNLISRKDALEQGLKRYYTGKPCKHGHVAEISVSNRSCLECKRVAMARANGAVTLVRISQRKAHPDYITLHDAKERGLLKYFTGLPCLRGHVAERQVSTSQCCTCANDRKRVTYREYRRNPEWIKTERKRSALNSRKYRAKLKLSNNQGNNV